MRRGRAILSFALALLWLGMPVHCQLEAVAASAFLTCCADSSCPPQQDSDSNCAEDFCESLESGDYFPQKFPAAVKLPAMPVICLEQPQPLQETVKPQAPVADSVPLLTCSWQFAFRAVAPPRAPSSLS